MKRVVWIISEGSPGHLSQSQGLVATLSERIEIEKYLIETRQNIGGLMRKFVRLWMGSNGRALSDHFLRTRLGCEPPGIKPDLIVTSGGKAVFAARSLAVSHGAPLVFLGERKPYPSSWFHTVFTPSPFETDANDVLIEMIPTGITPERVNAAAHAWKERPDGNLWAMIIGGTSASHAYTDADWKLLASKMNTLAQAHDIRWLVSTSRRTGAHAEVILREHLNPQNIAYAVWWSEKPEKLMAAFLGSSTWVCVTQDSVTMVTEAVASGRPVLVTMPAKTAIKPSSFLHAYFGQLEAASRIVRVPIETLELFHPGNIRLQPRSTPIDQELATSLLSRLQWRTNPLS